MKTKAINSKMLGVLLAIFIGFINWGVASADYHQPGMDCTDCHDMHGGTSNLKLIAKQIPEGWNLEEPIEWETVEFLIRPDHYADGYGARICEVCHEDTNYYTTYGTSPGGAHHEGEDCMSCHSHCDEFRHGAAPGPGCDQAGCHGHDGGAGTLQSHTTHTENDDPDERKGPQTTMECDACHDTNLFPYFASGTDDNDDGHIDLDETDVCDPCHSAGGAFDGVDDNDIGVKKNDNWAAGIYETDGTLQTGKEYWCASCHDADQAIIDGQTAPNIAGDNIDYGFYVTGHGATGLYNATLHGQNGPGYACTVCHDSTLTHISGTLEDPRLNAVAGDALDYTSDVSEVCLDCHLVGQSGNGSLGYDATAEASVHSGGVNEKYNTSATAPTAWPAYGDSADYATNPGYQCEDCHDLHGSQKLAMVLATIDGNVGGTSHPVSVAGFESTDTDLTDLDPSATVDDGVCDVCHASGGDPHPDANHPGNHNQGDNGDSCMVCHSHTSSFAHGGGAGEGCEPCHGHDAGYEYSPGEFSQGAGTVQSHSTHTENDADDLKGPNIACGDCHDINNFPYFKSGTGDPPYDLSETDLCDECHSQGGAFDGVAEAKAKWEDGVYESNGYELKAGNENWCATCHDEGTSTVNVVDAPNVMGNSTTYGYNVCGHGRNPENYVNCSDCHDLTVMHTDGMARTYESSLNNYKDGYRLKYSMDIPRKTDDCGPEVFELCFKCHTYGDIFGEAPPFSTNFRDDDKTENYHRFHLYQHWFDYWDSDWDSVLDSSGSCTACHNVHGSPTVVMTRHGGLISTPGTTDKIPALDFRWYKSDGKTLTTILAESRYGSLLCGGPGNLSTNNVCVGCHATGRLTYHRSPVVEEEGVVVERVWTTDLSNNNKTYFTPNEDIRYHVKFTITGPGSYFVKAIGEAFNTSGEDWETKFRRKKTLSEGTYHWKWNKTIPSNATPDSDAKVRITLKMFDEPGGTLLSKDKKAKKFHIVAP